ncbi:MAG TPA: thiolase domain-containing protein, partial [Methylomirabilota bacterium]|nr:thiolase domain-containing protein [Methylomirabilota bacterium]
MNALIAGVHEFPERKTVRSALEIQALSARAALDEAGLTPRDVDGYFTVAGSGGTGPLPILDYLNLNPRYIDGTSVGGASFVVHTHHAAAAITQGRCRVALVTYGSTARSSGIPVGTRERIAGDYLDQFEGIYGTSTVGLYAMVAQRHMHEYETTEAQLAQIAVACRRHAGLNPAALYRDPITVKDVLTSPVISTPLHLLDCCVITDGGGAVVLVHPDLARNLPKPGIRILGAAEAVAHTSAGRRDYLVSAAAQTAPRAFGEAGVSHGDVDMAMIYDSFTITVLMTLEDLGFCKKGEGGRFVEDGRLELGGELPINTDGGGLSSNHPGMRGIFLIIEAVRQLRGECGPRQVKNCRL